MKTFLPSVFTVCLMLTFSIFFTKKGFSRAEIKADSINSLGSVPGEKHSVPPGITPGRARSLAGGVLGLVSVVAGWLAKRRSAKGLVNARPVGIVAVILGLICIILSVVHLATIPGGFGTGGGKAGAIVALVLGTTGTLLGGLALRKK